MGGRGELLFSESSTQYIFLPPAGAKGNSAIWLLLVLFLNQGLKSKTCCGALEVAPKSLWLSSLQCRSAKVN